MSFLLSSRPVEILSRTQDDANVMKQILLLIALLVAVMFTAWWLTQPGNTEKLGNLQVAAPSQTVTQEKLVTVDSTKIKIEVAKTETERQIGLSTHNSLASGNGMLFVFDSQNVKPVFWMKGMKFSIDIIWINDNKVILINENLPTITPGTIDSQIPRFGPNTPVDYVLEVPAGFAKETKIKVGSRVEIPTL